jgi:hypothetical protein
MTKRNVITRDTLQVRLIPVLLAAGLFGVVAGFGFLIVPVWLPATFALVAFPTAVVVGFSTTLYFLLTEAAVTEETVK